MEASNDNDGRLIVGLKAIADVLQVDVRTVKRYAKRPRYLGGNLVRPLLLLKRDHADRVMIGELALARWQRACERPYSAA